MDGIDEIPAASGKLDTDCHTMYSMTSLQLQATSEIISINNRGCAPLITGIQAQEGMQMYFDSTSTDEVSMRLEGLTYRPVSFEDEGYSEESESNGDVNLIRSRVRKIRNIQVSKQPLYMLERFLLLARLKTFKIDGHQLVPKDGSVSIETENGEPMGTLEMEFYVTPYDYSNAEC